MAAWTPRKSPALPALILVIAVAAAGCAPGPTATIAGFYDALKKCDFPKASSYLQTPFDVSALPAELDDPENVALLQKVFGRITYSDLEAGIDGATATAKVAVKSPDLVRIVMGVIGEALGILLVASFEGEAAVAEAQMKVARLVADRLTAEDAPMTTSQVTVKLVKVGDAWLIADGENPLSFLTNGIEELQGMITP